MLLELCLQDDSFGVEVGGLGAPVGAGRCDVLPDDDDVQQDEPIVLCMSHDSGRICSDSAKPGKDSPAPLDIHQMFDLETP
jgi:hypothetical protein